MRVFRGDDSSQVLPFWGKDPKSTRSRYIQVTLLIDFQSVERIFAWGTGHIKPCLPLREAAVRIDLIAHDDFFLFVPVIDIEVLLVGGKGQAIGTGQFCCQ